MRQRSPWCPLRHLDNGLGLRTQRDRGQWNSFHRFSPVVTNAFSAADQAHGERAPSLLTASSGIPPHQRRLTNNVTLHRGIEDLAL